MSLQLFKSKEHDKAFVTFLGVRSLNMEYVIPESVYIISSELTVFWSLPCSQSARVILRVINQRGTISSPW